MEARSLIGLGAGGRDGHGERRALAVEHLQDEFGVSPGGDRHGARLCATRLMSTTARSSRLRVAAANCPALNDF